MLYDFIFTQISTNAQGILTTVMRWQLAPTLKNLLHVLVTQGMLVMANQHAVVRSFTPPDY